MVPFSISYVKGWRRCLALLICCQGLRELELVQLVPSWVKARFVFKSFCLLTVLLSGSVVFSGQLWHNPLHSTGAGDDEVAHICEPRCLDTGVEVILPRCDDAKHRAAGSPCL